MVLGEEVMAVARGLEPKGPKLGPLKTGSQASDYSLEVGELSIQQS